MSRATGCCAPGAGLAAMLTFATPAISQEAKQPPMTISAPAAGGSPSHVVHRDPQLDALPPGVKLAVRVESLRRQVPVIPDLVLVPDASSFVLAMSAWRREYRFPVLIDDGSWRAREDISRFARAFKPRSIVRWSREFAPGTPAWPDDAAARRAVIEAALLRAWGGTAEQMGGGMRAAIGAIRVYGIDPPGVVFADPMDTSWPAALALAIGHAQPIVWYARPDNWAASTPDNTFSLDAAEPMEKQLEEACRELGVEWEKLGDAIDAVTLCGYLPVRVQADGIVALSDFLGRADPQNKEQPRWAWCGQVWGPTESRAAYRAMSSLFLQPTRAWLFDGYEPGVPWDEYDMTTGAEALRQRGLDYTVDDANSATDGSVEQWRTRASRPLDAGLTFLNSKGNPDFFALHPGIGRPADTPFLGLPTITYVVHSFSAQVPADRTSVAGRWLERGAYLYFGAVDEPYLQSFIPTNVLTARLMAPMVFAAAVRPDTGPAWKHAVLGDPLACIGPPAPRSDDPLPFAQAIPLADELAEKLRADDLRDAFDLLVILGRDADASKLVASLVETRDKRLTPAVARAAMGSVFRTMKQEEPLTRAGLLARLFMALSPSDQRDGEVQDLLWLAANAELPRTRDDVLIHALREHVRSDNPALDSIALSRPVARLHGIEAARSILRDALPRARSDHDTRELQQELDNLRGR